MEPLVGFRTQNTRRPPGPLAAKPRQFQASDPVYLGKWELLEPFGKGEWSVVYRARPRDCPPEWPSDYAVKVARADGNQRQAEQLIRREAQLGRTVTHPHLVAVLSARLDHSPSYLVMPLLEGGTLRAAVDSHGPLASPHALWICRQTAAALDVLHEAGWIHADVKPGNIFVSPLGHATLLDLGFAMKLDSAECSAGGAIRGTMTYTAPEMISSAMHVDQRTDIYSLGVTLYEMLTGRPPFVETDPGKLVLAHLQQPAPNPRHLIPGLCPRISKLLQAMLAKEPLRRPSVTELIDQLASLEIVTLEERIA